MHKNRMVKRSVEEIQKRKESILYALLEEKQLTVKQLSKLINVNEKSVYNYINSLKPIINHLSGGIIELNPFEAKKYFEKELPGLLLYQKRINLIESFLEQFKS